MRIHIHYNFKDFAQSKVITTIPGFTTYLIKPSSLVRTSTGHPWHGARTLDSIIFTKMC